MVILRRAAVAILLAVTALPASARQAPAPADGSQAAATRPATEQPVVQAGATPAWVARSNANAEYALSRLARFRPEEAGRLGVTSVDTEIRDLTPGYRERARQANAEVIAELRKRLAAETDPPVRQDLEIMIEAFQNNVAQGLMNEKYFVTYVDVPQLVFSGLRNLLDDQVPAERRRRRSSACAGTPASRRGYTPIAELAVARARDSQKTPGRLAPFKDELERNLTNGPVLVDGLGELFRKYSIEGYEEPYARLKEQMAAYDAFDPQGAPAEGAHGLTGCRRRSTRSSEGRLRRRHPAGRAGRRSRTPPSPRSRARCRRSPRRSPDSAGGRTATIARSSAS